MKLSLRRLSQYQGVVDERRQFIQVFNSLFSELAKLLVRAVCLTPSLDCLRRNNETNLCVYQAGQLRRSISVLLEKSGNF